MNELQLTATLIKKCETETGTSKSGKQYQNRTFVVEVGGQYPKQVACNLFGDKTSYIDKFNEGDEITVKFSVESREYNGKYFTSINAYSVQGDNASGNQTTGSPNNYQSAVKTNNLPPMEYATQDPIVDEEDDKLPF